MCYCLTAVPTLGHPIFQLALTLLQPHFNWSSSTIRARRVKLVRSHQFGALGSIHFWPHILRFNSIIQGQYSIRQNSLEHNTLGQYSRRFAEFTATTAICLLAVAKIEEKAVFTYFEGVYMSFSLISGNYWISTPPLLDLLQLGYSSPFLGPPFYVVKY